MGWTFAFLGTGDEGAKGRGVRYHEMGMCAETDIRKEERAKPT